MSIKSDLQKAEQFVTTKTSIRLWNGVWLVIGLVIGVAVMGWVF